MSEIKTLSSQEIYSNQWMRLKEDRIERADGSHGVYSVIEKPDFAVIVPVSAGFIWVVEQYRYPLGVRTMELPQGSWELDPNADPIAVARGELAEETGLLAQRIELIGYQKLAQGYSSQGYYIWLATDFVSSTQQLDAEEVGLTCRQMPIAEFETLIAQGKISDATSVTAFLLAKLQGFV
ncbi:NUDIX domain-containing protein [Scandinavium goeteborgense]|uniref:NUDIX domain-containing protein n=1 Tax=Scandinavium goeteborgense TaxID=1851514 RepID=UPI000F677708|nr:NUDIX hydrolase [Scandinavium goeteborgense]QKN81912.1 NUDIX hydrolase [Scandinavium goeteborgense]